MKPVSLLPQHLLAVSDPVRSAIEDRRPVLALESTLISHGLPWPTNLEFALKLESLCREHQVEPATIGVIDGKAVVGLDQSQKEILARPDAKIPKLSAFDLPVALARGSHGSTTVAGTMRCALSCGLTVFATGGIGGVHRKVASYLDVSHDLETLGSAKMIVVSSGAKSILDLPATMEWLETKGVLVVGWQTNELPAFYHNRSGIKMDHRVDSASEVVDIFDAGLASSLLVANPIPAEYAVDHEQLEQSTQKALESAKAMGVKGKDVTPFLLQQLFADSAGKTLEANLALVRNNVLVGCQIAKEHGTRL